MTRRKICLAAFLVVFGFGAAGVRASFVQWDIDSTASKVTLTIPDQDLTFEGISGTARVRNQTGSTSVPWSQGNTAYFDGLLNTNYTEGVEHTIEFLTNPSSQVIGLNSGNYRPNPAAYNPAVTDEANPDGTFANTTTAAGVFGAKLQARVSLVTLDLGYINFYNTSFDLVSGPLMVIGTTDGAFDASGALFGLANSDLAVDGLSALIVGQPIPDTLSSIQNVSGAAATATGSITNLGGLNRRLNLTMTVPGSIDFEGTILTMTIATTIVADGVALFPGDADISGVVDFADLGILLNNYNQTGTFTDGDFDNSSVVDFTDLGILLNNYNQAAPVLASAVPVPEPSTLLLACFGLCGVGVVVRKQKSFECGCN